MSDINIELSWQTIVLGTIGALFWYVTAALVLAGALAWWRRRSRILWGLAGTAAALWLVSATVNIATQAKRYQDQQAYLADLHARQTTLTRASTISGFELPAGTVVTRASYGSDLDALDLPSVTTIRGLPLMGHVGFSNGGFDGELQLSRDATVQGLPCSARQTIVFHDGTFQSCLLARPTRVKGVPCGGVVDVSQGVVCTIDADYPRFGVVWRAGTKLTDYASPVWFLIGALPPSMILLDSKLGEGTEVEYIAGHLDGIKPQGMVLHYRGCVINLILGRKGELLADAAGVCALPRDKSGYILLPATSLR